MANNINSISIISRSSELAKIQAKMVGDKIENCWPEISINYQTTKTNADLNANIDISNPGEVGIFTKDISMKVIDGE